MSTDGERKRALLTQQQIETSSLSGWKLDAYHEIEATVSRNSFPCIFSRNAIKKQLAMFTFVETLETRDITTLASALSAYVELSRRWTGTLDTAYPLLAVVARDATPTKRLNDFHRYGWDILKRLHSMDSHPWPDNVDSTLDSPHWSMCFAGMPLFINMSCPAHLERRSRNLGGNLVLVINPRDRFDVFASNSPSGRNTRARIRSRIAAYDGCPHSPELGEYGSGSLEWKQYGLDEPGTSDQALTKNDIAWPNTRTGRVSSTGGGFQ